MKNNAVFISLLGIIFCFTGFRGNEVVPLSHYRFNGNCNDEGVLKQNGINNGAVFCADRFGKPNSAIQFNGENSYVEIPASKDFDLSSKTFSFSCWINLDSSVYKKVAIILAKGVPGKKRKGAFITCAKDLETFLLESWYGGDESAAAIMSMHPERNKWVHLVVTRNGITTKIYFNGFMQMQQNKPDLDDMTNDAPIILGGWPRGGGIYFRGAIDDLRIYNRALSESEAKNLYEKESKIN